MGKKAKSFKGQNSKILVTAGFSILICICILGIILIYNELVSLSKTSDTTETNQELVKTSNLLGSLYHVENTGNLLLTNNQKISVADYDSILSIAYEQIDSVKKITDSYLLINNLDSIHDLLKIKEANVKAIVVLLDSVKIKPSRSVKRTTILNQKDLNDIENIIKNSSQVKEDTVIVQGEKKSFSERVRNVFRNKAENKVIISKTSDQNKDSLIIPLLTDTLIQYMEEFSYKSERRHQAHTNNLVQRQNMLYQMNKDITYQINTILNKIERRVYENRLAYLKEKETILKRSSKIVSTIGILALCTALIFLIWTFISINHSIRYRKEIESGKKYAESLLAARERLIFSITHDIKSPVSSIIGYIELLSKNQLSEKEYNYILNMQHSAENILELVRNLLDYHSLESDKQEIRLMPFIPKTLFKDIFQSFVPLAIKKKIDFQYKVNLDDKQKYESDPYRIRQICENLLSNAIKYTDSNGQVIFSVHATAENSFTDQLHISVKDNGSGIPKEKQELIFEEFGRMESHIGKIEGSGLGLTITKKLIERLGGTISLISEPENGSEFTVILPLKKTNKEQGLSFPSSGEQNEENKGKRILFIDDDEIMLNLYSEVLKGEGFQTSTCTKSLEALSLLQTIKFDLIFTDIQIPDINGIELVERIRKSSFEEAKTIPVIALSANTNISEDKFKEIGFSGFLSKPFTSNALLKIIYNFLYPNEIYTKEEKMTQSKGIDSLLKYVKDDPEAQKLILDTFIAETKKDIRNLSDALYEKNWNVIREIAHKMISLMSILDSKELVVLLRKAENGQKDIKEIKKIIQLSEEQIKNADDFLNQNFEDTHS